MNLFETFLKLHQQSSPLLIGNGWDVTTARIFEQNGFKAIATSSRAIAFAAGYEDGEKISFDHLLQTVKNIRRHISIPLSVDMEAGYSRTVPGIVENIERLYETGVSGINLEDSVINENRLHNVEEFQKMLSSIKDKLEQKNIRMFLNIRTDAFLRKMSSALNETIKRAQAYESAGATGIFVPFIFDREEIGQVVNATSLPVNVLCMPQLPDFNELTRLGVKRISMGGGIQDFLSRTLEKTLQTIQKDQSFRCLW